jgi:N-acetylneuraminic acid mutarotase
MRLPAAQSLFYRIVSSYLVLAGLAVGIPFTQSQSSKLQGNWSKRAPLATKRGEVAVAALDGKIYVLGGTTSGNPASQLNQEYDPAADRWRDRAPLPQGMSHAGAVGFGDKLYVIGGFSGGGVHVGALSLVFAYDLATDSWRQLAPLSSPRGSVGVAEVGGKIHAIGGRGLDKVTVATHEVYDPATEK